MHSYLFPVWCSLDCLERNCCMCDDFFFFFHAPVSFQTGPIRNDGCVHTIQLALIPSINTESETDYLEYLIQRTKKCHYMKNVRTSFNCVLFHPSLSSHFICMDFFQEMSFNQKFFVSCSLYLVRLYTKITGEFFPLDSAKLEKDLQNKNLRIFHLF